MIDSFFELVLAAISAVFTLIAFVVVTIMSSPMIIVAVLILLALSR